MKPTGVGRGLKGRATSLHSKVVRARGACQSCVESDYTRLQCAHIMSRRYAATRTDENNAFCLCARCHMRYTEHADEWMDFIDSTIGRAEFDRLKAKASAGVKTSEAFWRAEMDRLTALLKEAA